MWNELGISGGTAIIILICAVLRYQMGSEKRHQRSLPCYHGRENQ